jgi:transposase InsO family protein
MEQVKQKRNRRIVPNQGRNFDVSFRLRVVKLYVEDGYSIECVCKESGISKSSLSRWVSLYRKKGRAGLEDGRNQGTSGHRLPEAVSDKIVSIKESNPTFGVRRISNLLRRWFCLPGSAESVRRVLHEKGPAPEKPKHRRSNVTRPRFFERSTPNQMWQTDIFTFRMGGRYAYLIGFIDDYSRYMVGLGLYLSQTADNVIELYRRAIAEYAVPKEMLTDNGRQYTSWHGTSRFESELKKDKVHHIKSQPHHPMTLGKIERFWKSIYEEFLARAQFESFENAQERVRLWVKYYNHRRPHQGIGGMCPADRYFEIQHELRKTIESAIAENVLEMSLRGKPKEPFYMVGRLEGQSVVLRAEKGKLKMTVDEQEHTKELEYDMTGGENGEVRAEERTKTNNETARQSNDTDARCGGEMPGGSVDMDGTQERIGSISGDGRHMDYIKSMAGTCLGGNAAGAGTTSTAVQRPGTESAPPCFAAEEAGGACEEVDEQAQSPAGTIAESGTRSSVGERRLIDESGKDTGSGADHHAGMQWEDQRNGRSETTGDIAQDLLRMGKEGLGGTPAGAGGWHAGQTPIPGESADAGYGTEGTGTGEGACGCQGDNRGEEAVGRIPTAAEAAARRYCFDR